MTDIVLVHGTTQTSAGYARLADALRERGHRPALVDVPSAAAGSAVEYAELLARDLPADVHAPVVAAHSGAGLLLPALAQRLDAVHQVWIAAMVADFAGRRSMADEVAADPHAVMSAEWLGVDPTKDPVLATYFLLHDTDLATLRAALPTIALCDLSALYAEVPPLDPRARPSTFVLPSGDRALRPEWMARAARERLAVEPTVLDAGHNLYVARPDEVAEVIDDAARGET